MGRVTLTWESCVRTRSTSAQCQRCVDACPTRAVSVDGPKGSVAVALAACIDCGLCHATCPTEAFHAPFDVARFVSTPRTTVTCGDGLPCIGALAVEDLVVLALAGGALAVSPKADCSAARTGHAAAHARCAEANALLGALGQTARVTWNGPVPAPVVADGRPADGSAVAASTATASSAAAATPPVSGAAANATATSSPPGGRDDAPTSPARRAFFRNLVGGGAKEQAAPEPLRLDVAALKAPLLRLLKTPARRERLLDALATRKLRFGPETLAESAVGFSSDKRLDVETCTACNLCVTVCPTGALTTSRRRDEVNFTASKCVKCRACHDVCAPGSIALAPAFDAAAFARGEARLLATLPVRTCGECGAFFKANGDDARCANCRDLDDEARELSGLT